MTQQTRHITKFSSNQVTHSSIQTLFVRYQVSQLLNSDKETTVEMSGYPGGYPTQGGGYPGSAPPASGGYPGNCQFLNIPELHSDSA